MTSRFQSPFIDGDSKGITAGDQMDLQVRESYQKLESTEQDTKDRATARPAVKNKPSHTLTLAER